MPDLNVAVKRVADEKELNNAIQKNPESYIEAVVCSYDHLIGTDIVLLKRPDCSLFVVNGGETEIDREWLDGLILGKKIEIGSKKQLMRHLGTKVMLYHYNQGLEHKKNGDYGLANLCFQDSLNALNFSAKYI